jgi:alkylated DNA repair dioxygenase AlkB
MSHYPRTYYPQALTDANKLFQYFMQHLNRKAYPIRMFGKEMMQPRLVSFYADEWVDYHYSQTILTWSWRDERMWRLRDQINTSYQLACNSVLCNLYHDGQDSMWWHSDDEHELGPDPIIVSVTLWCSRVFKLRHKMTRETISLTLEHGSVLVMSAHSQIDREHCIPKTTRTLWPRVNCTFRMIEW